MASSERYANVPVSTARQTAAVRWIDGLRRRRRMGRGRVQRRTTRLPPGGSCRGKRWREDRAREPRRPRPTLQVELLLGGGLVGGDREHLDAVLGDDHGVLELGRALAGEGGRGPVVVPHVEVGRP